MSRCAQALLLAALTTLPARAAEAQSAADAPVEEARAPAPKVAVVVVGDADDAVREAATLVEEALRGTDTLREPADPGLVRALRGEPGTEDDGLERARRDRRSLGLGDADDAPSLVRLGRMAGAVALAVVRAPEGVPRLEVFDVRAGTYYEGSLPLPAAAEAITRYLAPRARAAQRRARATAGSVATAVPEGGEAEPQRRGRPAPATGGADGTGLLPAAGSAPEAGGFLRRNWAYLAAGVALAVVATVLVVTRDDDASPQPVLRFRPGGGS